MPRLLCFGLPLVGNMDIWVCGYALTVTTGTSETNEVMLSCVDLHELC